MASVGELKGSLWPTKSRGVGVRLKETLSPADISPFPLEIAEEKRRQQSRTRIKSPSCHLRIATLSMLNPWRRGGRTASFDEGDLATMRPGSRWRFLDPVNLIELNNPEKRLKTDTCFQIPTAEEQCDSGDKTLSYALASQATTRRGFQLIFQVTVCCSSLGRWIVRSSDQRV
jgi:hypothetical protein